MPKDFRSLVRAFDEQGKLLRVTREVDPEYEVNAVIKRVQKTVNQPIVFENVRGAFHKRLGPSPTVRYSLAQWFFLLSSPPSGLHTIARAASTGLTGNTALTLANRT